MSSTTWNHRETYNMPEEDDSLGLPFQILINTMEGATKGTLLSILSPFLGAYDLYETASSALKREWSQAAASAKDAAAPLGLTALGIGATVGASLYLPLSVMSVAVPYVAPFIIAGSAISLADMASNVVDSWRGPHKTSFHAPSQKEPI